jgi:hypothetical protein
MPLGTFYPDANPETNTVDGRTRNSGATYSTVRNASDGNQVDDASGSLALWHGITGGVYYIDRMAFLFDTSIVNDGTVPSGTFTFYCTGIGNADSDTLVIVASNPLVNASLGTPDYSTFGSSSFGSIAFSSLSENATNQIALTDTSCVNTSSVTKIGLRARNDIVSSQPSGITYVDRICFADCGGTQRPSLILNYTPGTPGGANNLNLTSKNW